MKFNKIHLWVLLGLIVINLGLYFVNLNDFFVSDDFDWVYNTKTSQHGLGDYFSANYYGEQGVGGSYRPMVNVVFWLNYKIGGLNPLPYHLTNLIFHIAVCFLIYLLVLLLFEKAEHKQKIGILAALFFSLLPNHSEAVIWIAAVADPMAAFLYLLAFYGYITFRQKMKFYWLLISVASFILGLLTKEFVVTLPLLIIVWELYEGIIKNKFRWQDVFLKPLGYWLLVIGYFLVRFNAIGLAFGYYAQQKFQLHIAKIFKMFVALIVDLGFYGQARVYLTNFFSSNSLIFCALLILILGLTWLALKQYGYKVALLFDSFLIIILPVLFLSYNDLNDEGERYVYLGSVIFCILLSLLVLQIQKNKLAQKILLAGLLIYFAVNLVNKNYNWHLAANLSEKIVRQDLPQTVDLTKSDQKLFFVSLPDNLDGAQVLRNGVELAIKLYYPDSQIKAEHLNAYLSPNSDNYQSKLLYWGSYPTGGYIAETFDNKNWVTGFDRRETADYIVELWNYDYINYTSNTMRLIFKDQTGNFIKAGDEPVQALIFNEGGLNLLSAYVDKK